MRAMTMVLVMCGCGPMYGSSQPPAQQQPDPQYVSGPPGASYDPQAPASGELGPNPYGQVASGDPDPRPGGEIGANPYGPTTTTVDTHDRGDIGGNPYPADRRAPASDAQRLVDAHNGYRAQHCAAPVSWSPKLAQVAQAWANSLRDQGCMFGHSNGKYGENLAAGTIGVMGPEEVVKMWYDEVKDYRFPDGGFSEQTGHFTQVVWKGTKEVGCGHSQCKGMDIWVCEYDPPGNWEGQYRQNVKPRGCK